MRSITIYTADGPVVFEEKKNCDAIVDIRSEYPIVKIYIGERIQIFKGCPYKIEVDKLSDRPERPESTPGQYHTRGGGQ